MWVRSGAASDLTVDRARSQARQVNGDLVAGINPNAAKREGRQGTALSDLWTDFLENHSKVHNKPGTVAENEALWRRYPQRWETRRLAEITENDVDQLKARIGRDHGKYAANRALALLSTMFRKRGRLLGPAQGAQPLPGHRAIPRAGPPAHPGSQPSRPWNSPASRSRAW